MTVVVRDAIRSDAGRLAELHATRISEGFLPTLGSRFLRRLYGRIVRSRHAFAVVAAEPTEGVVGFAAAATDVGALYREFLLRDGVLAGIEAAPRLVANMRRVLETLRYPASSASLPSAEVLAVAVEQRCAGHGVGRLLVGAITDELRRRGVGAAKVVAGADNEAALRLYLACGFTAADRISVHGGIASEVLVWASS